MLIIDLVLTTGVWVAVLAVLAQRSRPALYAELWPFARYYGYPAVLINDIRFAVEADQVWARVLWILAALVWLYIAWSNRKPPDDRWKKRRKKALSRVKQVGRRLVVVPVPDPVPIGAS